VQNCPTVKLRLQSEASLRFDIVSQEVVRWSEIAIYVQNRHFTALLPGEDSKSCQLQENKGKNTGQKGKYPTKHSPDPSPLSDQAQAKIDEILEVRRLLFGVFTKVLSYFA
jgi:hypothetical protein